MQRHIYAAPSYLERYGTPRVPDDLLKHNCLNFTGQNVLNRWPIQEKEKTRLSEIEVRGNFLGNNGELLFQMAVAGVGLMRIADLVAEQPEREGKLVRLLQRYDPGDSIPLYAVWPQGRFTPPKVRVFVDYLLEKLAPAPKRRR